MTNTTLKIETSDGEKYVANVNEMEYEQETAHNGRHVSSIEYFADVDELFQVNENE